MVRSWWLTVDRETATCQRPTVNRQMAYYDDEARQLKRELAAEISTEELRVLHQKRPWLHALIAFANVAALVLAAAGILYFDRWYFWLPCAVIAGFAVFDFTVLLHEVVHRAVLTKSDDRAYRFLGLLYAVPSGISASQFTRWHLRSEERRVGK